jgi:hypothetical protein
VDFYRLEKSENKEKKEINPLIRGKNKENGRGQHFLTLAGLLS